MLVHSPLCCSRELQSCPWTAWASASSSRADAKIVFSRGNINVGTAIWTVDGDGAISCRSHTRRGARDNEPTWSPDRRQIAFVRQIVVGTDFRGDSIRQGHLMVMNADGTALRGLAANGHHPDWSPDGRLLAFVKDYAGDAKIWTIRPDKSAARQLARGTDPAWSPDGRRIAFSRYLGGVSQGEIFVMNSDGTSQRRLLARNYQSLHPTWSPDGRLIAFLGYSTHGLYVGVERTKCQPPCRRSLNEGRRRAEVVAGRLGGSFSSKDEEASPIRRLSSTGREAVSGGLQPEPTIRHGHQTDGALRSRGH